MNTLVKTSPAAVLATLLLLTPIQSALAQKYWNANDGNWSNGQSWSPAGNPPTGNVIFGFNGQSTSSTVNVAVSGTASINQLFLDFGKTVNLNFENGSSLSTTSGLWQLNTKYTTDTVSTSHLIFNGPATGTATVSIYALQVGAGGANAGGSSIVFNGPGLVVTNATGGGSATVVGRSSNDNLLSIRNGADVTLHAIWVSQSTAAGEGYKDNRTVVDNASLTINGGTGNNGLYIGSVRSAPGSSGYDDGLQNNSLSITNNGTVTVTTGNQGTSAGAVRIGFAANAHSNLLSVKDGGTLKITSKNNLQIGDSTATNLGGNTLKIGSGGTVRTNGTIAVYDYNASGQNDGRNKLIIENGGKLFSSSTITVNGLLRLEEGGVLEGKNLDDSDANLALTIEQGAVLEASGNGLGKNVATTIKGGGTLHIGSGTRTAAATLTLQSALTFSAPQAVLNLSVFGNGAMDAIHLSQNAQLIFNNTILSLSLEGYAPEYGDSWVLFTGNTAAVSGSFDLSTLPLLSNGLSWDTSSLNAEGNWTLAVIPEAHTTGIVIIGFACTLLFGAGKRRSNQASSSSHVS